MLQTRVCWFQDDKGQWWSSDKIEGFTLNFINHWRVEANFISGTVRVVKTFKGLKAEGDRELAKKGLANFIEEMTGNKLQLKPNPTKELNNGKICY